VTVRADPSGANFPILVICTGNLCRSPFGEHLLRRRLAELGLHGIAVASAGIGAVPGTACPANVLEAARGWGLDLSGHRSRRVRPGDMEEARLVLTMERYHYHALLHAFPPHAEKLHPLARFDEGSVGDDVADPMGLSVEQTRRIFTRIARCMETVARTCAQA
jgi:protein-tyrosine phosphatase